MYRLIRPLLFLQDPEKVHNRAIFMGKLLGSNPVTRRVTSLLYDYNNPALKQTVLGIEFRNPIGLAAGFDKDCHLMDILPSIGFGFEEAGSITAEPYEGNPGTRLSRLVKDKAIIVNYGLKNKGAQVLSKRLDRKFKIPIGVSVAKTNKNFNTKEEKLDDWEKGIRSMKDYGDYITINISCPNTYDQANFCDPQLLRLLLERIKDEEFTKPVFLKITSGMTKGNADSMISLCRDYDFVKGFVITNLVKDRSSLDLKSPRDKYAPYKGGISGKVVKKNALDLCRHFYKEAGNRFVIIGCGGVSDAEDAYDYIKNGASLVQLITGMIYGGPATIKKINKGLVKLLKADGHSNISEAVGSGVPNS